MLRMPTPAPTPPSSGSNAPTTDRAANTLCGGEGAMITGGNHWVGASGRTTILCFRRPASGKEPLRTGMSSRAATDDSTTARPRARTPNTHAKLAARGALFVAEGKRMREVPCRSHGASVGAFSGDPRVHPTSAAESPADFASTPRVGAEHRSFPRARCSARVQPASGAHSEGRNGRQKHKQK